MKLVIIYGPPASGKLSVAYAIAKKRKFKILHNHLIRDLYELVYENESEELLRKIYMLRKEIIELCVDKNINLICTLCYVPGGKHYIDEIASAIKTKNCEVFFVKLVCTREELLRRVENSNRKYLGKIVDKKLLSSVLNKNDFSQSINIDRDLTVDNTNRKPQEIATEIIKYFDL